ncbi:S1/P1 nuclease [uncultured Paraglaciecola sp.]|uniref:S1/P1 nuclease n=1 Tax=uncultured Paraglaciecola sp. TaxID=1765024 RepID=UPI002598D093|nr:S1/P1 nuclease [uncultured Paraglaciecola sp.]
MKLKPIILGVMVAAMSFQALSWGQIGHRVTGAIAENYLTAEAKLAMAKILPNETLAEASTWPDEMRSNPSEFWKKIAGPYHYVTIPDGKAYGDVGAPEQGDGFSALQAFTMQLKNDKTNIEQKQLALRFIIHIIGDLHQPFHAGNGTDRGGNDVKLKFFWQDSNLHRVWDSGLIDNQQLSYTEWSAILLAKISKQQAQQWMGVDPHIWIAESAKLRAKLYPDSDEISWDYQYQNLPIVKKRLQMGGVRIAAYLNELFK